MREQLELYHWPAGAILVIRQPVTRAGPSDFPPRQMLEALPCWHSEPSAHGEITGSSPRREGNRSEQHQRTKGNSMSYLVPSQFVTKMVDAGESKIFMSTRDT